MKRCIAFLSAVLALGGCANLKPSLPEGYVGPKAVVKDSVKAYSASKADFFYVSHVDGMAIESSPIKTRIANSGKGLGMTPVVASHEIPARAIALGVAGRTEYAAPILALTGTVYEVKGVVEFVAEPGKTYVVRGELAEGGSAVWIEEAGRDTVVGKKIEIKGPAKLGIFEK